VISPASADSAILAVGKRRAVSELKRNPNIFMLSTARRAPHMDALLSTRKCQFKNFDYYQPHIRVLVNALR